MDQIEVKLDDLPELPFELILSYLSLEDRIKARAVSRRWHGVIDSSRPKILCYSEQPIGFIYREIEWVHADNELAFSQTLNSFDQLEELDLFYIYRSSELAKGFELRLNLPMLKGVTIEKVAAIERLTLDAPRLRQVKNWLSFKLDLVHGESVEKLDIDELAKMEVVKLKNLRYLYCGEDSRSIDSTLLSTLKQLNEIHLHSGDDVSNLFDQKERYGRSNLKIFISDRLLNGPSDPVIKLVSSIKEQLNWIKKVEFLICKNQSNTIRLAGILLAQTGKLRLVLESSETAKPAGDSESTDLQIRNLKGRSLKKDALSKQLLLEIERNDFKLKVLTFWVPRSSFFLRLERAALPGTAPSISSSPSPRISPSRSPSISPEIRATRRRDGFKRLFRAHQDCKFNLQSRSMACNMLDDVEHHHTQYSQLLAGLPGYRLIVDQLIGTRQRCQLGLLTKEPLSRLHIRSKISRKIRIQGLSPPEQNGFLQKLEKKKMEFIIQIARRSCPCIGLQSPTRLYIRKSVRFFRGPR
ncbi:hypothetical protein L1887_52911 [Cichorium endivia]|nr:hypothetical protein L1887_52911 [Cichorium endivia]